MSRRVDILCKDRAGKTRKHSTPGDQQMQYGWNSLLYFTVVSTHVNCYCIYSNGWVRLSDFSSARLADGLWCSDEACVARLAPSGPKGEGSQDSGLERLLV